MDTIIENMLLEAEQALPCAYAPYSQFKVACSLCTDKGNIYTGVNVENGSYGLTLCAEASAICKMISAGEKKIQNILVIASSNELCAPCGACRQRIYEFSNSKTQVYLAANGKILSTLSIDQLLPLAFDFKPQ